MRHDETDYRKRRRGTRRGVRAAAGNAILEMALVLMMLMFLAMGMVEYGQYFYLKQAFETAARDGCRVGITAPATQAATVAAITASLAKSGVTFNSTWARYYDVSATGATQIADVSTCRAGDGLMVVLSTSYSTLPTAVRPLSSLSAAAGIGTGKAITGTCNMIRE